ncbi:unnamed protein product [Moneuplotes crassus]|uniref:Uncharacterized protein n=1 Tax=Euplotes crassus TaxID=5936 RepID=A0AAD1U8Q4_EUPCR|nr:unnamed protein product [Moneuplotes crassus]
MNKNGSRSQNLRILSPKGGNPKKAKEESQAALEHISSPSSRIIFDKEVHKMLHIPGIKQPDFAWKNDLEPLTNTWKENDIKASTKMMKSFIKNKIRPSKWHKPHIRKKLLKMDYIKPNLKRNESQKFITSRAIDEFDAFNAQSKGVRFASLGGSGKTPRTTRASRPTNYFNYIPQSKEDIDLARLRKQEIEYLKNLAESGKKIPKDKINIFKLLILKEDPLKIGEAMIKKQNFRGPNTANFSTNKRKNLVKLKKPINDPLTSKHEDAIEKARLRMERKMEIKLVSQAAQNFNIHLHFRNLKRENQEYLDKLNMQISNKLDLYINPTKRVMFKVKRNQKNEFDTTSSDMSSSMSNSGEEGKVKEKKAAIPVFIKNKLIKLDTKHNKYGKISGEKGNKMSKEQLMKLTKALSQSSLVRKKRSSVEPKFRQAKQQAEIQETEEEDTNKEDNSGEFKTTKQIINDYVREFNNTIPSVLNL